MYEQPNYPSSHGGYPQGPYPSQRPQPQPHPHPTPASPAKKSNTALWLGLGCLGVVFAGGLGLVLVLVLVAAGSDSSSASTTSSPASTTPAVVTTSKIPATLYVNEKAGLKGDFKENYVRFSTRYPKSWELDKDPSGNFFRVARRETTKVSDKVTNWRDIEVFSVGYHNKAPEKLDMQQFLPASAKVLTPQRKTRVGKYEGMEVQAQVPQTKGEVTYMRLIALPVPPHRDRGVFIFLLGSNRSPDISSIDDVGTTGGLQLLLDSLRLGDDAEDPATAPTHSGLCSRYANDPFGCFGCCDRAGYSKAKASTKAGCTCSND